MTGSRGVPRTLAAPPLGSTEISVLQWFTETVLLHYHHPMRNVTVSVPDEVYRAARIRAAEADSSVSGLVAAYLKSLSSREARFAALKAQQQEVEAEIDRFSARDRLDREELHDRAVR